ncbi:MAG: hypothetical protein ACI4NI_07900 [Candidatus Ornithospirochaeta sp.]
MNGIISEIITTLDYADEVSNERDTYFRAFIGGKAIEEMDYFVDNDVPFSLLTKLGKDMQGETHLDFITDEYGIDEDDILFSSAPSALSMEGTLIIKSTAPSFIKKEEVIRFIDEKKINRILISSLLLSFDPVRKEILEGLEKRKDKIERVVIDAEDATSTIMIEDLYDSVKRLNCSIKECYISGDILNIEGVKRVSSDMIKELFV